MKNDHRDISSTEFEFSPIPLLQCLRLIYPMIAVAVCCGLQTWCDGAVVVLLGKWVGVGRVRVGYAIWVHG